MSKVSKTAAQSVKAAQQPKKEEKKIVTLDGAVLSIKALRAGGLHVGTELIDVLLAGYEAAREVALDYASTVATQDKPINDLEHMLTTANLRIGELKEQIEDINDLARERAEREG